MIGMHPQWPGIFWLSVDGFYLPGAPSVNSYLNGNFVHHFK